LPFGEQELASLEAEILSAFSREKIVKPDDVRGNESNLPEGFAKARLADIGFGSWQGDVWHGQHGGCA